LHQKTTLDEDAKHQFEAFYRQELHACQQTIEELQKENAELRIKANMPQRAPKVSASCPDQRIDGNQSR